MTIPITSDTIQSSKETHRGTLDVPLMISGRSGWRSAMDKLRMSEVIRLRVCDIQASLGQRSSKTTEIYTHVLAAIHQTIRSPLDTLNLV